MDLKLSATPFASVEADALIVLGAETEQGAIPAGLAELDGPTGGVVADIARSGEFKGKTGDTVVVHRPSGLKARRLILSGRGKTGSVLELRRAVSAGLRTAKRTGAQSIAVYLPQASPEQVEAAAEGALFGNWESDRYLSKHERKPVQSCELVVPQTTPDLETAVKRAAVVGESQNLARDLQNEPPNVLAPMVLAERSRKMAAEVGLECEILDQDQMRQMGMGSLLAVAQGSSQPPALIVLKYRPAGSSSSDHLGLVGKGVTFDTGGISIKPADNMDKMKYDMSGGAAMIGAMRAIAQLKPGIPVTGLIPTVENMPGSNAQRPGDIVTTLSGKTVEVLNTDAEGRMILNDALTYAKRLGCTHLVDAATLTGAIVVALGHHYTGVFSNDDAFRDKFLQSAARQGEKMWPMPLDDEFMDLLKSPFADIANVGGRWGGSITAALFLREFAEGTPWIHLDIAGTASHDEGRPFAAKGR